MNRKLFTVTLLVLCIMSSGAMQATQPVSADQKAREVAAQSRARESAQKADHATAYPAAAAASAPVPATADLKNAVEDLQQCLDAISSVNIIGLKKLLDENNYCLEALERLESHNKAEMKKKLAINARDSQFPTMVSISKELQTRMTQAHNAAAQLIDNHLKELNTELQFYRAIFPSNEHDEKKRQKVMQNETIKSLLEATQPTALMRAAFLGDAKQVAELLKTATEQTINAQHIGKSALMFATMMGHAPIAKMLLAHKASVKRVIMCVLLRTLIFSFSGSSSSNTEFSTVVCARPNAVIVSSTVSAAFAWWRSSNLVSSGSLVYTETIKGVQPSFLCALASAPKFKSISVSGNRLSLTVQWSAALP